MRGVDGDAAVCAPSIRREFRRRRQAHKHARMHARRAQPSTPSVTLAGPVGECGGAQLTIAEVEACPVEIRGLMLKGAPIYDSGINTAHCGRAQVEARSAEMEEAEEILNNLASNILLIVVSTNQVQLQAFLRRLDSNETSLQIFLIYRGILVEMQNRHPITT